MASPSSCHHCENSSSDSLKNGWDLSTGKFAQLCDRCYSIYESGRFCETFHKTEEGWRNCQFCSKPIHCACLVSFNEWLVLEAGHGIRVICMECSKITSFLGRNFSNEMNLVGEGIEKFRICSIPKSEIVPMFEKLLHAGDIDNSDGSIVIPKKHAEAYFPEVSDPNGIPLEAYDDTDIKEWNLHFRFWLNKMYVLDGLREYMVSNNLQGGDTLTFSRVVPNGPYVIGYRKASTNKPSDHEASTSRRGN
ncbi:hypothetical protein SSX86_005858 [Deinandra increscens subsp. villosa]|uniref:TF-B3 domain-containing protein n=1 Tax=Deinandra increscens subsp. villosa TaxID=3103831 RepID=A0AAP0HA85_9ASTR